MVSHRFFRGGWVNPNGSLGPKQALQRVLAAKTFVTAERL
jgi:hypothetical protein